MSFTFLTVFNLWMIFHFTPVTAQNSTEEGSSTLVLTRNEIIPWKWTLKPDTSIGQHTCPTPAETLGTFAIVNALVVISNLVFGHRKVLNRLTGRFFGHPTSRAWRFMFLVPLTMQLVGNFLVAARYSSIRGYNKSVNVGQLVLFYSARPRLGWLVLRHLRFWGKGKATTAVRQVPKGWFKWDRVSVDIAKGEANGYYEATEYGLCLSETLLQLLSMYYYGLTAGRALVRGYFRDVEVPGVTNPRMMFFGAFACLLFALPACLAPLLVIQESQTEIDRFDFCPTWTGIFTLVFWIGSWIFWVGYVTLAGDLCAYELLKIRIVLTIIADTALRS
jgi:hypothetical protein